MIKKLIVRLRMWYADIRGHHGKRWNYEPGDWYMGRHRKRKNETKNQKNRIIIQSEVYYEKMQRVR